MAKDIIFTFFGIKYPNFIWKMIDRWCICKSGWIPVPWYWSKRDKMGHFIYTKLPRHTGVVMKYISPHKSEKTPFFPWYPYWTFLKALVVKQFMKTKIILKSNTIVFDPFNLFVFVNICLLVLFKKFNMDITEKMVSFQIIQNVINVKTTLKNVIS